MANVRTSSVGKKSSERVMKEKCPQCHSNKMFSPRGITNPQYSRKCTKCGYKD